VIAFWVAALSLIGGRVLERYWTSPLSDLLVWTGSIWIGALVYFLLAAAVLDLTRLLNHLVPFFPSGITADYSQTKYVVAAGTLAVVACLLIGGHVNAVMTRLVTLDIRLDKRAERLQTINIVAASDIHLGTIVGRNRLDGVVETINSLHPDVVLLPGDIVDEDLGPVIKQNLGESLRNIRSRFGVFAVTGNHEYIGGVEKACAYLTEHGVVMLRDQAVMVDESFFLVGREDRSANGYRGKKRKSLAELMQTVDITYPVILMDHQPFQLEEAVSQGIDLQLSGHTHHGQLWPVNYIIKAIYEVGWGYKKIAGTHIVVSNGFGTWGPPVRIGNRPEILNIRLRLPARTARVPGDTSPFPTCEPECS
jgi:predicted MPP superfamily phosphohydrolase